MIILDFGSGNSCRNDWNIAKGMIDSLAEIDTQRECIIKWQLFRDCKPNILLEWGIFHLSYDYARGLGFQITASVFDLDSLKFLLTFDIPFVKIANRRDLDWLIGEIPRKIKVIRSVGSYDGWFGDDFLCCISKYPATIEDYESGFGGPMNYLSYGISDHTADWILYRKYHPEIYECHFVLEHDSNNPDGGPFARTPNDLAEILRV